MNFFKGEFRRSSVRNSLRTEFNYFTSKSCNIHTLEILAGTNAPDFSTKRCWAEFKHINGGNYLQIT